MCGMGDGGRGTGGRRERERREREAERCCKQVVDVFVAESNGAAEIEGRAEVGQGETDPRAMAKSSEAC